MKFKANTTSKPLQRHKLISFILLLFAIQLSAQESTIDKSDEGPSTISLSIINNGIFKNPGINFRYEHLFSRSQKEAPKRKTRELIFNGNFGFYWDPYTHIATYTTAGVLYRKTNKRDRQWTIGINPIGFMRTFVHEAYEVDNDLNVSRKRFAGRSYYAPELIVGTGKIQNNEARFFNIHLMILGKYNTVFLPLINFEFGYRF